MAFSAAELDNIFNAALKFYIKDKSGLTQTIQDRPLLRHMAAVDKTFSGGNNDLSLAVKGVYGAGGVNDSMAGYSHDDKVKFYTPKGIKRAEYTWREMHIGITLSHTELKIDGMSVVDTDGDKTNLHPGRDRHVLVGLFENKLDDLAERYAVSENNLTWGDGVADAKAMAGIRSIMFTNPLTGTVGGLDAALAANSFWRNRARTAAYATALGASSGPLGGGKVTSSATNGGALIQVMQVEWRQLRRFGGFKQGFILAGSDFIGALETEMRANGTYSDRGFTGKQDPAMGEVFFKGKAIEYDPTLDDDGFGKFAYFIDSKAIHRRWMTGERRRHHTPSRPADQFVLNRSITDTGQMVCNRRNSSMIMEIA